MSQIQELHFLQAPYQKTHEWLMELMAHTGRQDEQKAWQMLRAVLHILRDRLTIEQCAHLSAQLPMVIRGLYFEGWKPANQPLKIRNRPEFIHAVAGELDDHPEIDPNQAIEGVFRMLHHRISRGELNKIKKMLQPELQELWGREGEAHIRATRQSRMKQSGDEILVGCVAPLRTNPTQAHVFGVMRWHS